MSGQRRPPQPGLHPAAAAAAAGGGGGSECEKMYGDFTSPGSSSSTLSSLLHSPLDWSDTSADAQNGSDCFCFFSSELIQSIF